jgi:hypothetical protein
LPNLFHFDVLDLHLHNVSFLVDAEDLARSTFEGAFDDHALDLAASGEL